MGSTLLSAITSNYILNLQLSRQMVSRPSGEWFCNPGYYDQYINRCYISYIFYISYNIFERLQCKCRLCLSACAGGEKRNLVAGWDWAVMMCHTLTGNCVAHWQNCKTSAGNRFLYYLFSQNAPHYLQPGSITSQAIINLISDINLREQQEKLIKLIIFCGCSKILFLDIKQKVNNRPSLV